MGMFMASVSFRKPEESVWLQAKERIQQWISQVGGLNSNLHLEEEAVGIVSPYGEEARILSEMAMLVSKLIGGTVIFATCHDSDFNLLEVYQNGEQVENCCIGEVYEEFAEFMECNQPNFEFWNDLLLESSRVEELRAALYEREVCAEDNLRKLSELIGLPVFDDALVFEGEDL